MEETEKPAIKAKVTKAFDGVPDGAVYPKSWEPGDIVEGDLARVAVAEGWAKEEKPAKGKPADEKPE